MLRGSSILRVKRISEVVQSIGEAFVLINRSFRFSESGETLQWILKCTVEALMSHIRIVILSDLCQDRYRYYTSSRRAS